MVTSETSPLVNRLEKYGTSNAVSIDDSSCSSNSHQHVHHEAKSSLSQTVLNIIKMCVGTGVLAIPFAATEGGILFSIIGLGLVTVWNIYSVDRMIESKAIIQRYILSLDGIGNNGPNENTNELGLVTWYVFGDRGLLSIDFIMISLMTGIIVAYEDAILGFIHDTPFTSGNDRIDAVFIIVLITPVLFLPNYESISKVSALGTSLIGAIFLYFTYYGYETYGLQGISSVGWDDAWPKNFSALSNWFGVAAFGVGLVPFTYSMQESMQEPKEMMKATRISLTIVFLVYVIIGDVITILFDDTIKGDILSELPVSIIATIIRMLMTIVVLTSVPLILIPAGDLIHDKILGKSTKVGKSVYLVRFALALLCAFISVEVPDFVSIISFVGCFCVALLSFAYPPLLHLRCVFKFLSVEERRLKQKLIIVDIVLLLWGVLSTIFTSFLAFQNLISQEKE